MRGSCLGLGLLLRDTLRACTGPGDRVRLRDLARLSKFLEGGLHLLNISSISALHAAACTLSPMTVNSTCGSLRLASTAIKKSYCAGHIRIYHGFLEAPVLFCLVAQRHARLAFEVRRSAQRAAWCMQGTDRGSEHQLVSESDLRHTKRSGVSRRASAFCRVGWSRHDLY